MHSIAKRALFPPRNGVSEALATACPQRRGRAMSDTLVMPTLLSQGYGQIAKMVTVDERMTCEAKCIYALLASFSGGGTTAFPSIDFQCRVLHICRDTTSTGASSRPWATSQSARTRTGGRCRTTATRYRSRRSPTLPSSLSSKRSGGRSWTSTYRLRCSRPTARARFLGRPILPGSAAKTTFRKTPGQRPRSENQTTELTWANNKTPGQPRGRNFRLRKIRPLLLTV